jgi:uncharacterized protein (DUF58 family)
VTPAAPVWRLAPAVTGWLVAGTVLVLLGVLTRRPDVTALGAPFLLGVGWSLTRRPATTATVRVTGADQPAGGSGVTATLHVTPGPGSGLLTVRVSAPGHRPTEALLVPQHRAVEVQMVSVRTGRRELFGVDHREATADALHSTPASAHPALAVTVLPAVRPLDELPLPPRLQGLTGPHGSRRIGDGGDLRDVGPFVPGDRLRRIDWRVTARLNAGAAPTSEQTRSSITRLYTRRTFATADATVMLVVDSRDDIGPRLVTWGDASALRENEATSLDIARTAAASLARRYLVSGDRVGLEDLGRLRRPVPPAGGRQQLLRLVQRLALAEPEGEPVSRQRLPRLPSGCLIIVLSTFLDTDAARMASIWRRGGHRVIAVDTLPRVVLLGANRRLQTAYRVVALERADRMHALRRTGVEVIDWTLDRRDSDPALELTRLARQREHR